VTAARHPPAQPISTALPAPPVPTDVGSVTFGTPTCGDQIVAGTINALDCMAAVNQMLENNCASGSCNIPPSPGAGDSDIRQTVGTCTTLVVSLGGNGATFNEAPVQDTFPGFIAECVVPMSGGDDHDFPNLVSTNAALTLAFEPSAGGE
jgi:hypothetical protein